MTCRSNCGSSWPFVWRWRRSRSGENFPQSSGGRLDVPARNGRVRERQDAGPDEEDGGGGKAGVVLVHEAQQLGVLGDGPAEEENYFWVRRWGGSIAGVFG